jgi:hypothetical protein
MLRRSGHFPSADFHHAIFGTAMIAVRSKNFLLTSLFFATLILTLIPVIAAPLTGFALTYHQFILVIGLIGNAHVGMTLWFFLGDSRYKEIIRENRFQYVALPLISIAIAFALFTYYPKGIWPYFTVHYAWLMWHFGRQNFGIYAFVAAGNKSGPVTSVERQYFNLLPIAIIPKVLTLYPDVGFTGHWAKVAVNVTIAMSVASAALAVWIYATEANVRKDWQRSLALFMGLFFFLPAMLSSNPGIALSFFAHPVQYVIMMLYLAADRKQSYQMLRVTCLFFTGIVLWAALTYFQVVAMPVFFALAYGITQAHFIVDMGLWKLKLPKQRAAILESYDFLFNPDAAKLRGAS